MDTDTSIQSAPASRTITCSICGESSGQPLNISCGHTACRECLSQITQSSESRNCPVEGCDCPLEDCDPTPIHDTFYLRELEYIHDKKKQKSDSIPEDALEFNVTVCLRKGKSCDIFHAEWMGIDVALRRIRFEGALSNELADSLMQEVQLCRRLHHPNVVRIYGAYTLFSHEIGGLVGDTICIVTEYAARGSLRDELVRRKRWVSQGLAEMSGMARNEMLSIAEGTVRGLAYLHNVKINNLRLDSGNVLLDDALNGKIGGIGISVAQPVDSRKDDLKRLAPPEVIAVVYGEQDPVKLKKRISELNGEAIDIWAIGILLWEMFTGEDAAAQNLAPGESPPIPSNCYADLAHLMMKCCSRAPEDRPPAETVLTTIKLMFGHQKVFSEPSRGIAETTEICSVGEVESGTEPRGIDAPTEFTRTLFLQLSSTGYGDEYKVSRDEVSKRMDFRIRHASLEVDAKALEAFIAHERPHLVHVSYRKSGQSPKLLGEPRLEVKRKARLGHVRSQSRTILLGTGPSMEFDADKTSILPKYGSVESSLGTMADKGQMSVSALDLETTLNLLVQTCSGTLHCVILSSPKSADLAKPLTRYVPCVIAAKGNVSEGDAVRFSEGFYGRLQRGHSIKEAFYMGLSYVGGTGTFTLFHNCAIDPGRVFVLSRHEKLNNIGNMPLKPPPLPLMLTRRDEEVTMIKEMLLSRLPEKVVQSGDDKLRCVYGIVGMAGIGKSVLAQIVCADIDVKNAFPDGILWMTLGRDVDDKARTNYQSELVSALSVHQKIDGPPKTDIRPRMHSSTTTKETRSILEGLLADSRVLVVLDDAWSPEDVAALTPGLQSPSRVRRGTLQALFWSGYNRVMKQRRFKPAPKARVLVTSRRKDVLNVSSEDVREVAPLSDSQAWSMLVQSSGVKNDAVQLPIKEAALKIAGNLPLSVSVFGGMLGQKAEEWTAAMEKLPSKGDTDINRVIGGSVENLKTSLYPGMYDRFLDLGVFGENVLIPRRVLHLAWTFQGLGSNDVEGMINHLISRSLLHPAGPEYVTLHDLLRTFVISTLSEKELRERHRIIVKMYAAQCVEGAGRHQEFSWTPGPMGDSYYVENLAWHLAGAGMTDELIRLLTDFRWIRMRLQRTGVGGVLADHDHLHPSKRTRSTVLVLDALRLSASSLKRHAYELGWQIASRLGDLVQAMDDEHIIRLVQEARQASILHPLRSHLAMPGSRGLLQVLGSHTNNINDVAIFQSEEGDARVISAGGDRNLGLWDLKTGQKLGVMRGHRDYVTCIKVLQNKMAALSGSADRTLRLWDLETGSCTRVLEGHIHVVNCVAVSRDESTAVSGSGDNTVRLWNLNEGTEIGVLKGHNELVYTVDFYGPSDEYCISGGWGDNTLRTWDLDSLSQISVLEGHVHSVMCLCVFGPQRMMAASGALDGTVRIWDLTNSTCSRVLDKHTHWVMCLNSCSEGKQLLSGSGDRTLRLWDVDTGLEVRLMEGHSSWVTVMSVHTNQQGIVRAVSGSSDGSIVVWDVLTGEEIASVSGLDDNVSCLQLVPDGENLTCVAGLSDRTIRKWNTDDPKSVTVLGYHERWMNFVAVANDASRTWVVSGSVEHGVYVRVLDKNDDLDLPAEAFFLGDGEARCIAPCGKGDTLLAVASSDKSVGIWDIATGELSLKLKGHRRAVDFIAVYGDGNRLLSVSRTLIKTWDIDTGKRLQSYEWHSESVNCVAVTTHKDGSSIAVSGSDDKTLKLWDLDSDDGDEELATLVGHVSAVTCLRLFDNDSKVVSGSKDGTLRVWDLEKRECACTLSGHTAGVNCVEIYSSVGGGRTIAISGSDDLCLKGWDILSAEEVFNVTFDSPIHGIALRETRSHGTVMWVACGNGAVVQLVGLEGS